MATTSRYLSISAEQVAHAGRRIETFLQQRGKNKTEITAACQALTNRAYRNRAWEWNEKRIGRIISAGHGGRSKASSLDRRDGEIIATLLGITYEALIGAESENGIAVFDPTGDDAQSRAVRRELGMFIGAADEVHGWGVGLPASMELPEFMQAHHAALFADPDEADRWNILGQERRTALEIAPPRRNYILNNYIFLEDLARIADGAEPYHKIGPELRRNQFDEIIRLVSPPVEVRFFVAKKTSDAGSAIAIDLQLHDTVVVVDDKVAMERNLVGFTWRQLRPSRVNYWRGIFDEFRKASEHKETADVIELLKSLRDSVR